MPQPLLGPKDVLAVWIDGGVLTVVDARANLWTYDGTIVVDSAGDPIVAPTTFTFCATGRGDRSLVIDGATTAWIYDPAMGGWHQGV
jgi:hypothetical protein